MTASVLHRYPQTKGLPMLANGYLLVALDQGQKKPKGFKWQENPLTKSQCSSLHPACGIGMLCGVGASPICVLDFDVLDEKVSARLKEAAYKKFPKLNLSMCRVGRAPKFALVCRAQEAGWHKRSTARFVRGEQKAQLEVLGAGNQMVAYNVHPDTGKPYSWHVLFGEPCDIPAEDLPVLTSEDVTALLSMTEEILREEGFVYEEPKPSASEDDEFAWADIPTAPMEGVTIEYAERIIRETKPNFGSGTHDRWVQYGMALHHQFGGSDEALDLWDRMSLEFGADAYAEGECRKRWASFGKRNGASVTFRTILRWHSLSIDPDILKLSDMGLYKRFLYLYGDKVLWIPEKGTWYVFDPTTNTWEIDIGAMGPKHFILQGLILEDLKKELEERSADKEMLEAYQKIRQSPSAVLGRVWNLVNANKNMIAHALDFDRMKGHVLCANGIVDMATGNLQQNRPEFRMYRRIPFAYNPSADCPVWKKTVREILGDKDDVVRFFQKLMGSALGGAISDNYLGIIRGFGNNGKSLLLRVLAEAMGGEGTGYAETLGEETLLGRRGGFANGGSSRSDLVKLAGARWVYCAETSQDGQLREADVKRLTGNDTITCRAPYGRADVNIRPTWRMMLVTNHRPTIKGDDDGVWRRIADVDCPRNFDKDPKIKKDPFLYEKCAEELPGILNWLIEGYRLYKKEGAELPASVRVAVEEYRAEMDDVREWLFTEYEYVSDESMSKQFVATAEMYLEFKSYLNSHGVRDIPTTNQFVRRVKSLVRTGAIPETTGGKPTVRKCLGGWRLYGFKARPEPSTYADDFTDIP